MCYPLTKIYFLCSSMSALAKEEGADEDMAEMISSEIATLTAQIKDLEERLKVI